MVEIQEKGIFTFKIYTPEGKLRQVVTSENTLTTEGAARIWNRTFNSGSSNDTGYVGLIGQPATGAGSSPAVANTNTATDIRLAGAATAPNGWVEPDDTGYTIRLSGTHSLSTNQTAWSDASYTMGATQTIAGAFLANVSAISSTTAGNAGTGHTLYAASIFTAGDVSLGVSETIKVSFQMNLV